MKKISKKVYFICMGLFLLLFLSIYILYFCFHMKYPRILRTETYHYVPEEKEQDQVQQIAFRYIKQSSDTRYIQRIKFAGHEEIQVKMIERQGDQGFPWLELDSENNLGNYSIIDADLYIEQSSLPEFTEELTLSDLLITLSDEEQFTADVGCITFTHDPKKECYSSGEIQEFNSFWDVWKFLCWRGGEQ